MNATANTSDPQPIIAVTAEPSFRAVAIVARLANDVVALTEGWASKITARGDSAVWPVLDLLARAAGGPRKCSKPWMPSPGVRDAAPAAER